VTRSSRSASRSIARRTCACWATSPSVHVSMGMLPGREDTPCISRRGQGEEANAPGVSTPAMSTATTPAQCERLWWYTSVGSVCCDRKRRGIMGRWFAALYDTLMAPLERGGFQAMRKQPLRQARGTVLEIRAGTGGQFPVLRRGRTRDRRGARPMHGCAVATAGRAGRCAHHSDPGARRSAPLPGSHLRYYGGLKGHRA
jgi:hypothetical protein